MLLRTLAAFSVISLATTSSPAEERMVTAKVGDTVLVSMTGDVAKEYVRLNHGVNGVQIEADKIILETTAVVAQRLDDGCFRIDHFSQTQVKGKPLCLVTFSTVVNAAQIKMELVPEDTPVFSAPSEVVKAKFTTAGQINFRLSLSTVKGVTLRSWKLDEEVGN